MRGGAIPVLAWALLLTALVVMNAIWEGTWLPAGQFAFAAAVIFAFAAFFVALAGKQALRKGPSRWRGVAEAVPEASVGAVGVALSLALLVFGFVFGSSLIYMGAGFLALSLGRVAIEIRSQHERIQRMREEDPR
jgi:hypothetical protein